MNYIKVTLIFLIKSINLLLGVFGFKLLFHRSNGVHRPVVYDQFLWEPYYENSPELKLYDLGMKTSFSTQYDNPYKQLRFYSLQNVFKNILRNNIHGDIVECGVWKGHSAFILATLLEENKEKEFHIFDSFEGGLSDKTTEDKNRRYDLSQRQIKAEKNSFSSTEEQVKLTLQTFEFIHYHKGWIPEKFSNVENRSFCFIHIDVDLYQPTLDSLNFFYPLLSKGGAIVIDDYGISQFPGARKAVEKFLEGHYPSFFYKVPFGSCFLIK